MYKAYFKTKYSWRYIIFMKRFGLTVICFLASIAWLVTLSCNYSPEKPSHIAYINSTWVLIEYAVYYTQDSSFGFITVWSEH